MRTSLASGLLAIALLASRPAAQQPPATPPPPQPPTFRVGVGAVRVDVTVIGRDGQPVTDLTREDFEVREDSVVQRVQLFQHLSLSGQPPAGSDESLAIRSPDHARQEAARDDVRLLVIFLDDYHLEIRRHCRHPAATGPVPFHPGDDAAARPVRGDGAADPDFRSRPDAGQKRAARAHQQGAGPARRLRAAAQPDRGSAHAAGRRRPYPHSCAGDPVGARFARRASGRPARRPQVDPLCEPGPADAARRRRPVLAICAT